MNNYSLEKEVLQFAAYLTGRAPSTVVIRLYLSSIMETTGTLTVRDQRLLQYISDNNWSLGIIDSGLALIHPDSEIRRRLYFLFSIMEAMPEYADLFLPKKRSRVYIFSIIYHVLSAMIKALFGTLFIKIITFWRYPIT
jgi:hypothetical protein